MWQPEVTGNCRERQEEVSRGSRRGRETREKVPNSRRNTTIKVNTTITTMIKRSENVNNRDSLRGNGNRGDLATGHAIETDAGGGETAMTANNSRG